MNGMKESGKQTEDKKTKRQKNIDRRLRNKARRQNEQCTFGYYKK